MDHAELLSKIPFFEDLGPEDVAALAPTAAIVEKTVDKPAAKPVAKPKRPAKPRPVVDSDPLDHR